MTKPAGSAISNRIYSATLASSPPLTALPAFSLLLPLLTTNILSTALPSQTSPKLIQSSTHTSPSPSRPFAATLCTNALSTASTERLAKHVIGVLASETQHALSSAFTIVLACAHTHAAPALQILHQRTQRSGQRRRKQRPRNASSLPLIRA